MPEGYLPIHLSCTQGMALPRPDQLATPACDFDSGVCAAAKTVMPAARNRVLTRLCPLPLHLILFTSLLTRPGAIQHPSSTFLS